MTLNDDTLPSPDALMVTGITPQKTVEEGYTEAQFARMLSEEIFTTDTIAVGFNTSVLTMSLFVICFGGIFTIHTSGLGKMVGLGGICWMWYA